MLFANKERTCNNNCVATYHFKAQDFILRAIFYNNNNKHIQTLTKVHIYFINKITDDEKVITCQLHTHSIQFHSIELILNSNCIRFNANGAHCAMVGLRF